MKKRQKTVYDVVPTVLAPVVLVRFSSRKEAQKFINESGLVDK